MVDTTASWLAALIDGEGSVMLTARNRQKNWRPVVAIYNTDLRLMDALVERTGGGVMYTHNRQLQENHKKTAYSWRMRVEEIRAWLPLCTPWMVCKKEQATLLLEALVLKNEMRSYKGAKLLPISERDTRRERIADIAADISRLNRKGRHVTNVVSQLP